MAEAPSAADSAALARGGRTNFTGFLLRLGARFPFLLLAARLYGAQELGLFAYATMVVEFVAALAVIGLKRGLANEMARSDAPETHVVADALVLTGLLALIGVGILLAFPVLMFPTDPEGGLGSLFALVLFAIVVSDVTLAALAFRHKIGVAVQARSVIEPWVLTIVATGLAFSMWKPDGLLIAYMVSLVTAAVASAVPAVRTFGLPHGWRPSWARTIRMARRNMPLAGADMAEWATRRLDIFLLGRFASVEVVGIYYVAQQIATLAGRIRGSFDPILAPMLSVALRSGDKPLAAAHVRQVGFWVLAFQMPVVLALGLSGEGVLGLFGPAFAAGALVLALLLSTELAAANSSLAEMALIFTKPRLNLLISSFGLGAQAVLSLLLIPRFGGEGAAASLLLSMIGMAFAKQWVLQSALGARVAFWRWSLLAAGLATFLFGLLCRQLPEAPQMILAIPGTLIVFGAIIWRWGFNPNDRLLFARGIRRN